MIKERNLPTARVRRDYERDGGGLRAGNLWAAPSERVSKRSVARRGPARARPIPIQTGAPADYEFDHVIALELGGHPSDPHNLWPEAHQPTPGSPEKDTVENYLKREVCADRMTLADAQKAIITDWVKIWKQIGSP